MKEENKVYWAGVWFALGIGITIFTVLTEGASSGIALLAILFVVVVAALGSWLTSGVAVAAMLMLVLEKL